MVNDNLKKIRLQFRNVYPSTKVLCALTQNRSISFVINDMIVPKKIIIQCEINHDCHGGRRGKFLWSDNLLNWSMKIGTKRIQTLVFTSG